MKKVVIAEDIRGIIEKEECFLHRSSIKVFSANTNEDVFDLHKVEKADLIIANLDSPKMNGEMLCSLIRSEHELSRVSIIIMCSGSEDDAERCAQCSANTFITAPVNTAVLLQEAYKLLNIASRTSCRISVDVKIHGAAKAANFSCYAENISASGMFFKTDAILPEGDIIKCTFSLPEYSRISTDAEIVRVIERETEDDENYYGITFTEPAAKVTSAITEYVDKHCTET